MKNFNWKLPIMFLAMLAVVAICSDPVFAQTIPQSKPAQLGKIIAWGFRLMYAVCAIIGAVYIVKAVMMFSDQQQGTGRKALGGVFLMMVSVFVGAATEISQGNIPDFGLGDLFQ